MYKLGLCEARVVYLAAARVTKSPRGERNRLKLKLIRDLPVRKTFEGRVQHFGRLVGALREVFGQLLDIFVLDQLLLLRVGLEFCMKRKNVVETTLDSSIEIKKSGRSVDNAPKGLFTLITFDPESLERMLSQIFFSAAARDSAVLTLR